MGERGEVVEIVEEVAAAAKAQRVLWDVTTEEAGEEMPQPTPPTGKKNRRDQQQNEEAKT